MPSEDNDTDTGCKNEGFELETFMYSPRYLRRLLIADIVLYSGAAGCVWLLLATGSRESLDSYGLPLIGIAILGSLFTAAAQSLIILVALIGLFLPDEEAVKPDFSVLPHHVGLLMLNCLVIIVLTTASFNVV